VLAERAPQSVCCLKAEGINYPGYPNRCRAYPKRKVDPPGESDQLSKKNPAVAGQEVEVPEPRIRGSRESEPSLRFALDLFRHQLRVYSA
jgi:hypothetical protein